MLTSKKARKNFATRISSPKSNKSSRLGPMRSARARQARLSTRLSLFFGAFRSAAQVGCFFRCQGHPRAEKIKERGPTTSSTRSYEVPDGLLVRVIWPVCGFFFSVCSIIDWLESALIWCDRGIRAYEWLRHFEFLKIRSRSYWACEVIHSGNRCEHQF